MMHSIQNIPHSSTKMRIPKKSNDTLSGSSYKPETSDHTDSTLTSPSSCSSSKSSASRRCSTAKPAPPSDGGFSNSSGHLSLSSHDEHLRKPVRTHSNLIDASVREEITDPYRELGVTTFNFVLFPEGEDMIRYNKEHPKAHTSFFTSEHVWETGSAQKVLEEFITKIHPDDVESMATFVQKHLEICANWEKANDKPRLNAAHEFRAIVPGKGYRWQELRTRLCSAPAGSNASEELLSVCDGAFLDITDMKERELDLENKTLALQREVLHHQSTQSALQEALTDIREANQKLKLQKEVNEIDSWRGLRQEQIDSRGGVLEDLESLRALIEGAKFPQQKWAKNVLSSLSEKLGDLYDCAANEETLW